MKKMILVFALFAMPALAQTNEPLTCGDGCNWSYDETTKTLTITGSGPMKDFGPDEIVQSSAEYLRERPWNDVAKEVENVVVNGLSCVGNRAFEQFINLKNVNLDENISSIGTGAFFYNSLLKNLEINDSVTSFGLWVFKGSGLNALYCAEENKSACVSALNNSSLSSDVLRLYQKETDGSVSIYDSAGNIVAFKGKRIYTVEEAEKVSKKTGNTFKLRYK